MTVLHQLGHQDSSDRSSLTKVWNIIFFYVLLVNDESTKMNHSYAKTSNNIIINRHFGTLVQINLIPEK
jgi:hypothetical protein